MTKNNSSIKSGHLIIWATLSAVVIWLLMVTVFLLTGGERISSEAQDFSFDEDFSTTTFMDPTTTADWDPTIGEASLFHGEWTTLEDLTLKGPQEIPQLVPGLYNMAGSDLTIGPDDQPWITFSSIDTTLAPTAPHRQAAFSRWNPTFFGPDQGAWVKMDSTQGADILSPLRQQGAGPGLGFDTAGNPIAHWWARPTVGDDTELYITRWCPLLSAWGNMTCTATGEEQITVNATASQTSVMVVDSVGNPHITYDTTAGVAYQFWNGATWTPTPTDPPVIIAPAVGAINHRMSIGALDQLYMSFSPGSATIDVITKTVGSGWTNLTGGAGATTVMIGNIHSQITDPATGDPHFFTGGVKHVFWNESAAATPGGNIESFLNGPGTDEDVAPGVSAFASAFNPAVTDDLQVLIIPSAFAAPAFYHWNGSAWTPHPKKTDPEIVPLDPAFTFATIAVNSSGVSFVLGRPISQPTMQITRFTKERVDEARNIIQSTSVDSTDLPIESATLTLSGVSEGINGTQPLNVNGRNAFVDVDLQFSNDGGLNFYPATVGEQFIFPTLGTNLVYKLTFDSGTLLDRPVIDSVHIDYTTAVGQPNLTLLKGVDTNSDGSFTDDGQKVNPGDTLAYQIRVANDGTAPLNDVVVTDNLPPGTTYVPGSTTLNGNPVPDSGSTNQLFSSGINVGTLDSGTFVQAEWSNGPGQTTYGDHARFDSENGTRWRTPEVLKMPTDNLFVDERFTPEGQAVRLDQTQAEGDTASDLFLDLPGLQGAVMLNDGRLFATWWKDFDGSPGSGHVVGRFFSRDGIATGNEFVISTTPPGTELHQRPAAVQLSTGDIIVAWNRVQFFTSTEVVLQRLTSMGTLVGTNEIVIDSAGPGFTEFVDLDMNPLFFLLSPKSTLVADVSGNFYMGWTKSAEPFPGCGKAFVAGFDALANPLPNFPATQINESVGPESCSVRQAPSLAISPSGKLIAAFSAGTSFGFGTKIRVASVDFTGISPIISGPVDLFSGSTSLLLGPVANMPSGTFVVGFDDDGVQLLQRFDENLVPLGPIITGTGSGGAVLSDVTLGRVVTATFGFARLFDQTLTPLSGVVGLGFPGSTNAAIDPGTQSIWAIGGNNSEVSSIFGTLLQYEPSAHVLFSSVIDSGQPSTWGQLDTTQIVPAGSELHFKVRTGNTSTPEASWSLFTEVAPGAEIPAALNGTRYLQYQVEFVHSDVNVTPELHDLTISRQGLATIEFKVRVNATSGTVIGNTATASAAGGAVTSVATTQNTVGEPTVEVIGGVTRLDTAILVSQQLFPTAQSADAVVLIRSDDLVEGLSGAPLAAQLNAPILLTPTDHLDANVLTEIKRLIDPTDPVVMLGREKALSENVADQLRAAGFKNIQRDGGPERTATSALIALHLQSLEPATIHEAFIANAYVPADALSSSSPASIKAPTSTRKPVLLTAPDRLSPEMQTYLNAHPNLTKIFIAGGIKAVGSAVEQSLRSLAQGPSIERIAGPERFATSTRMADRFFPSPSQIFIMSGTAFPGRTLTGQFIDALLVGPIAARNSAPAIFVAKSSVPDAVRDYLLKHRGTINKITVIGGPNSIEPKVYEEMLDLLK